MTRTVRSLKQGMAILALSVMMVFASHSAQAATAMCSQFGGVVDGYNPATLAAIQSASSFGIDMNCIIKNFPQSMGGFPIVNINFQFPGQQSYYIAFLNVYYYGHMSCQDPTQSTFWIYWAPGGFNNIDPRCQDFMVPVDAVQKVNPASQTTAAIGSPFTYTITVPTLGKLDASGIFQYVANVDNTDVMNVVVTDDLTTSGAALTYVSNTAYMVNVTNGTRTPLNGGAPLTLGASSTWLTNHPDVSFDGTKHLVFSYEYNPELGLIPAGSHLEIDVTVTLDNSPINTVGKQFTNTSYMWFNKTINSTGINDLEAQPGTTPPMTIVEPNLVVTKSTTTTNLNVGFAAPYTINVQNTGGAVAWNTTITDNLPAGMCAYDPRATATARVFAADGVTPVSGPLTSGTDFSLTWNGGTSAACQLGIVMLSSASRIGPNERLIINYQAMIDSGIGAGTFTNVAGATRWFSADSSFSNRIEYDKSLTDGTPGVLDFQDAVTVTTNSPVLSFTKTVFDVTTGQSGATARPGDMLRYTLTIQNTGARGAANFSLTDELDRLNSTAMFVPGSLSLLTVPAGANTSLTSPSGGAKGTGLVSISNLNIDASGGANDRLTVEFQARLVPAIANGTTVLNQAQIGSATLAAKLSDDPALGGTADPTQTIVTSAPIIRVLKTVQDITSGTSIVNAGDILRYTIKVNNIGMENAVGVTLRDLIPANTSYIANSTRLNGTVVADPSAGVSALQNGMLVNAPANLTAGVIPADASQAAGSTVTVAFDVQIGANVADGTIISNQGFVNGNGSGSGPFPEQPSDDPATPAVNDPTSVVVGNLPLVYALKTVRLMVDNNGNGLVDPGDVLRYTIAMTNSAAAPATGVVLTDAIPANTTYVASSTTLNGTTVADPSAGISPLAGGMGVVSSGLTAPSPASSGGTLAVQGTGTVTFDVRVNGGVPSGTVISNQGSVATTQLPLLQTDSDGNSSNGYQPTIITVGNVQRVSIMKTYAVVGGGLPLPGSMVEYTITATNIGAAPATSVVITDDLTPMLTQAAYVPGSATMNGSINGVSYAASMITANYGAAYGALPSGSTVTVRFRVILNNTLTRGTTVTNIAQVAWNTPATTATASVSLDVNLPVLSFTKTVFDVTTGQTGATARPGDTLRYTLTIQNTGVVGASNFSLTDELDKLNTTAMFVPGSLSLITFPAGANTSLTSASGGAKGTGLVSISSLNIDATGGARDSLVIEFQVRLVSAIANGTRVLNQAEIGSATLTTQLSDDPSLGGTADPTQTIVSSAPIIRVFKTIQDMTSGTSTVRAGDILRYTIKVNNIGIENAVGVTLRDLIPANTSYVANSTRLNGLLVADPGAGVSALQNGMSINAPANLTAGVIPSDVNQSVANTATVTFDVMTSTNVVDGTIISNQGFVNGSGTGSGPFPEQPSDDPTTTVVNDPTSVVVGNVPLLYALKTVRLVVDNNGNGFVDPGDVLRYTIALTNSSATPATGVVLTDATLVNTAYVSNTTTLNGSSVADPSAGISPFAGGMGVASLGQTPPASSGGTLAAQGTGTVTFDVRVNAGVPSGTIISNQGSVATTQLPPLQTDSDGNPSNGYQPTVITVGNAQQVSIIKSYAVAGGGAPLPGAMVEYTITATNISAAPATSVVITDDLTPILAQAAYVAGSATMNGSANGVVYSLSIIRADYGATYGALAPGNSVTVRFRVILNSTLAIGTTVTNNAQVAWNTPTNTATASVSLDAGTVTGTISGRVWQDTNFNKVMDGTEPAFVGWAVDVYRAAQLIGTVYTGSDGTYQINGLDPNTGTPSRYELRFHAPDATTNTAMLGWADSPFTNSMQRISNIILPSGGRLQNLNLPLTPNGVVYNASTRAPIAGATLTMVQALTKAPLPASCFSDPVQQGQVTLGNGFYKFDLNMSDASACPSGGDYLIQVAPAAGYMGGVSRMIPPKSDGNTVTFNVPACPGSASDAVPATASYCEAEPSALAPAVSVPAGPGTVYYLHLTFDNAQPGDSQIYNNHIALDPISNTAVAITKISMMVNVTRGQQVPYTITLRNTLGADLQNLSVVDTFPPGFKYVAGSGSVDGQKSEPVVSTKDLVWNIAQLTSNSNHTIKLLLVVGAGVSEGDYVNHAQVVSGAAGVVQASSSLAGGSKAVVKAAGSPASGIANATVRVIPDPTMDCTDIIGKVFDDANMNGYEDSGEQGLAGVRIVSARGLIATTDKYGRYHITCAAVPDAERGSNFILKLDDRTLPTGYRVTTENPLVLHLTRGKAVKYNFGATLHRVVRLDTADGVFEPVTSIIREQWMSRFDLLMKELDKAPSILRISYLADIEKPAIVRARIEAVKREVASRWKDGSYTLSIETEIYWRRGGPVNEVPLETSSAVVTSGTDTIIVPASLSKSGAHVTDAPSLGQAVEQQSEASERRTLWGQDGDKDGKKGDKVEMKKVLEKEAKTVKLQNLVPPIHFASGEAVIPSGYVERLRDVLDSMKGRHNVRLHLVGHTDNAQLLREVKQKYGDNLTLSRERAGVAAEYFQNALHLPAESVTYEGVGESQPVASNATEQGKTQNRRVEVEVWYDEITDKLVDKEVVVVDPINRVKVCRVETVCKVRYKDGHSRRARIKNLVEPLHFDDDTTAVPENFVQKVSQELANLGKKEHVVVKFIGYTDNLPLNGRAQRIYGDHVALSKARARRAALTVAEALKLPASAIDVDGKGSAGPIASNESDKGRALNQRIEVEFWYDDALQELADEPRLCPEFTETEIATRVYDDPNGGVRPILFENGKPVISQEQFLRMKGGMEAIKDKSGARIRFIGYTNDERLERRTAGVYGDDIGLSTERARRTMSMVKEQLGLKNRQAEFEGHGYVQSDDVVNTGFVTSDIARVEVQVVYDELLASDDMDRLDVTRLTRELTPKDPLALNLMRITVDGKPIDDPGKSIADIERCTDVALDKANVQFKFDDLNLKPRLNVTAWPNTISYQDDPDTEYQENLMRFRTYTNYAAFIKRSEVRIFGKDQSVNDKPVSVTEVGKDGRAEWQPVFLEFTAPVIELKYVLRVYDKDGRFDETKPLPIWIVNRQSADVQAHDAERELLVGYGENHLAVDNIPKQGGTVTVYGSSVPTDHSVFVAGHAVPIGMEGKFVSEEILPSGRHTVEVAILDKAGNGDLFLRDLDLKKSDWFYVGIADVTASRDFTTGPADIVTNDQTHYKNEMSYDGRLAYYTKGKFGNGWELTSSADTLEGPLKDIFRNFGDKSGAALFRTIDPKYYYPTYGDDSSLEEGAPTLGKFYVKLKKDESYGMWGNFKVNYGDNDLAHIDRGLYGADLHYQTRSKTSFGEQRVIFDGFAAQPGTVGTREEFLGTGGSLYYLHHQGILTGSESVHIEVRDKDSGNVTAVKNLVSNLDYTVDYLQGRVSLSQPLSPTASDGLVVTGDTLGGNRVYLVVRYEYEPSAGDTNSMILGGQTHVWLNDYVKLGVTSDKDGSSESENKLNAADLTVRKSALTWIKVEASQTSGAGLTSLTSIDGGMTSNPACPGYTISANGVATPNPSCSYFGTTSTVVAGAYRIDASIGFSDLFKGANGQMTLYTQNMDAGYSAPGLATATDTKQYGGTLKAPVTDKMNVAAKVDKTTRQQGLDTTAAEIDVNYQLTEHWTMSPGVRQDDREDHSPVVPPTQMQGERTDAALRATYDSKEKWNAYGFVQDTVGKTGNREDNGRIGTGGEYRVTDRIKLNGEVSSGDLGGAGKFGTEYLYSDRTSMYLNYVYDNETPDSGVRAANGNMVSGFKTRYSDSTSIYVEEKYTYGKVPTGLTHATGVDLAPFDHWNFGVNVDYGSLRDPITAARLERHAAGVRVGYGDKRLVWATAFEYRVDKTELININPDMTTTISTMDRDSWLVKNDVKYQLDESSRLLGKLNMAQSRSSAAFFGGNYTEAVFGYGYRPVTNDRLNMLFKYTYFYNVPTTAQVTDTVTYTATGTVTNTAADFIQKSHILSLDALYDITQRWTVGGKYAYRLGWISDNLQSPTFFKSRASLYILRADWHFVDKWSGLIEGRLLDLPDAHDRKSGFLTAIYRQMGRNIKAGVGYNFSDFSDDLTQLSYKHQGLFINVVGEF